MEISIYKARVTDDVFADDLLGLVMEVANIAMCKGFGRRVAKRGIEVQKMFEQIDSVL